MIHVIVVFSTFWLHRLISLTGSIQTTRFWIEIGQQLLAWISTANSNAAAAVQGEM